MTEDIRTNPETCLHNIVEQIVCENNPWLQAYVICVSCEATVDFEFGMTKNYQYDFDNDVWVHVPKVIKVNSNPVLTEAQQLHEEEALARWRLNHPRDHRSDEEIRRGI